MKKSINFSDFVNGKIIGVNKWMQRLKMEKLGIILEWKPMMFQCNLCSDRIEIHFMKPQIYSSPCGVHEGESLTTN